MDTCSPPDLAEADLQELEQTMACLGRPRFHARQIFQWIHKRGVGDFDAMSDLGLELRADLKAACRIETPAIVRRERSEDGTTKYLLGLADGKRIEAVMIPERESGRLTFCISSQVGC